MISLHAQGQRFQLRAAAVVVHEGHVLAHRAAADPYWSLPGGRVEVGEDGATALRREMREELAEDVDCQRLLFVAEAFFSIGAQKNHELGLYFLAELSRGSPYLDKTRVHEGVERHKALQFRWLALDGLTGVDLRPHFLRSALQRLPDAVVHVVHRE